MRCEDAVASMVTMRSKYLYAAYYWDTKNKKGALKVESCAR